MGEYINRMTRRKRTFNRPAFRMPGCTGCLRCLATVKVSHWEESKASSALQNFVSARQLAACYAPNEHRYSNYIGRVALDNLHARLQPCFIWHYCVKCMPEKKRADYIQVTILEVGSACISQIVLCLKRKFNITQIMRWS